MTEASAVIELLIRERERIAKEFRQVQAALDALGWIDGARVTKIILDDPADPLERRSILNGGRSAAIANGEGPHPDRRRSSIPGFPAEVDDRRAEEGAKIVRRVRAVKRQLELAVKAPAPAGPPAWAAPTVRGTERRALPKRGLDDAVVAYLRREQHRAFVRVTEMAGHLEPTFRKPGRPDISWRESVSKAMVRLAEDGSIRRVAGRKGAYTVLRRSPGVEVAASKAKRKPRNRKAHGSG